MKFDDPIQREDCGESVTGDACGECLACLREIRQWKDENQPEAGQ